MKQILFLLLFSFLFGSCDYLEKEKLEKQKVVLELSEKCNKAGREYVRQYQIDMNDRELIWDDPEFHYNKKMNKCLAHVRYIRSQFGPIGSGSSYLSFQYNQVVDVFENKVILYGWFTREKDKEELMDVGRSIPNYTSVEYFKRKDQLFSE